MSKGYIFMRNFNNQNSIITISKYLAILILILISGLFYSCGNKDKDSGIRLEEAGDRMSVGSDVGEESNINTDNDDSNGFSGDDVGNSNLGDNVGNNNLGNNNSENGNSGNNGVGNNGDGNIGESETDNRKFICVHIVGCVVNPGVYDVAEGSRIYEVVRLAGGFLPEADESYLNLASVVFDGQKIEVLSKEEAKTAKPFVSATETETSKKLININTATKEELMQLAGIGESRALSIISYREKYGGFKKISDIMKVSGIKEAAFEKIKDYICTE